MPRDAAADDDDYSGDGPVKLAVPYNHTLLLLLVIVVVFSGCGS
jgi:hypothetical protein